jgi:fido (protein-threonine AMPylation protein)
MFSPSVKCKSFESEELEEGESEGTNKGILTIYQMAMFPNSYMLTDIHEQLFIIDPSATL